ncbi:MAG: hypothetical protein SH856_03665, partial [Flavobacteriales bacterium]|nr:hypothetical protein [Flavobacteriales bacterium]
MKISTFSNAILRGFATSVFVIISCFTALATEPVSVNDGCVTCNNVTNAGSIGVDQTGCTPFDPATITSIADPTGGSGALEIIWVYWNASTNWNLTTISGATSLTYNPGPVTEDTYFRRCSRRAGCSDYVGESNDVFVDVNVCSTCNGTIENLVIHNLDNGLMFSSLMNGGTYSLGSLPSNWNVEALLSGSNAESVKFTWTGSYVANNTENSVPFRSPTDNVVLNLGVGTYTLNAKLYSQDNLGGLLCDELALTFSIIEDCDNLTFGGLIGNDQSGCGAYNPEPFENLCDPSGGSGALEIIWMYKNESTGWNWVVIAGANGLAYDSGPVSETTVFIRCARRNPCTDYTGESNEVTVTVTGPCCFYSAYDEQYNQSNGTTFSSTFTSTYSGSHIFSVQSGAFTANDTDSEGVWTSSVIDIAGQGAACISLDISETGSLEDEDYIKVYYKLDGGAEVALPNGIITNDFGSSSLSLCGLIGSTLQVIVKAKNSAAGEFYYIDNVNVNVEGDCTPLEICLIDGYQSAGGRIFWIPGYGTDFKSSPIDPLKLTKYSGGIAHLSGTIERIADSNQKFVVSLWFNNKSTYAQWIAQGNQAHTPELGDETAWTFYDFDSNHSHTLVGAGSLLGTTLFLENQMDIFGLQLGNGANSLNNNASGISTWFSYTGTTSGNGDINGSYDCGDCTLDVDAGLNQDISCLPGAQTQLNSTVTGAEVCETPPVTDCNHPLANQGGWLENSTASTICGDNAGTKLWTQSGQGTSYITLDLGVEVPAGTAICVNMKLEHCSNSSTGYSDAKIQASTSSASGFVNLTSSVTFSQTNYQEFCYTLGAAARYIKISDNGYCAFRVDYVEYTTPGSSGGDVDHQWTGPGIVGASNGSSINVNAAGTYIVVVTDCDNCTASDTVQVTGTTCSPIIFHNVPADVSVQCDEIPSPPNNVYGSNDCDEYIEVSYSQQIIGSGCSYSIIGTWTAVDNCGNSASDSQTIWVSDTEDPVFADQPGVYDLGCNESVSYIQPVVTDNCDNSVSLTYTDVNNCVNNASDCDFKTYTPGGWGAPANGDNPGVYRDANFAAAFPGGLTVGCGIHTLTLTSAAAVEAFLPAGGTPAALTQEYVNPGNGFHNNLANHLVALTLSLTFDSYDPDFAPSNDYLGGGVFGSGTFAGMTISQVVAIANNVLGGCSNAYTPSSLVDALTGVNENFDGGANGGFIVCSEPDQACYCTVIRVWTATDDCNNSSNFTQLFNVGDNFGPVASEDPENIYIECSDDLPAIPNITWTDDCGEVLEAWYCEETVVVDECNYQIIRMWHANDGCNVSYVDQIIYVNDETAPVIYGVPAEVTIECDEDIMDALVWATDNCDNDVLISLNAVTIPQDCGYLFIRTWTAIDNCNNTSSASQTVTVVDYTNPVLHNIPDDYFGECAEVPEVPADIYATDNCDTDVTIAFTTSTLEFSGCHFQITRTWTATDDCGNSVSDSQIILVHDDTPPGFAGVSEIIVECGEDIPYLEPTVTDNCSQAMEISYTDIECSNGFISDWFAYSSAGGNGSVDLTSAPTTILLGGSNYSESAGELVDGTFGVYTASVVTAANVEICFDWYYTTNDVDGAAFDPFGYYNGGDLVQLTTGGFGAQSGSDCVTVEALTEFAFATWATDDALGASSVTISNISVTLEGGCAVQCPNVDAFIRQFSTIDGCYNTGTFNQYIFIQDTTEPVLHGVPDDMTGLCDADFEPAVVTATDTCDDDVEVNVDTIVEGSGCNYTITYYYTASDGCGNSVTDWYTISVVDLTPPVIHGVPADVTVECDNVPGVPTSVFATDNCDEDVDL